MRKKTPEKLVNYEKLTIYLEILNTYQLDQNINFSDSKCNIISFITGWTVYTEKYKSSDLLAQQAELQLSVLDVPGSNP